MNIVNTAKIKRGIAVIASFCLLASMVLSLNLTTVKAAGTETTGAYTITPSSIYNANMNDYDNSQTVTIAVTFNAAVTVGGSAEDDFDVVLNGTTLANNTLTDPVLYRVEAGASSSIVNIVLYANGAIDTYPGDSMTGTFFALRKAQCSITPVDEDGILPDITDSSNDEATWDIDLTGLTLHTGFELNEVDSDAATVSTPASVSYNAASLAQVRGITWIRLLKNGTEVSFGTTDATAYPILTVGSNHYFALHCHHFETGDNNYYMTRIYNNMITNYTGFTANYDISYASGVLTITQKAGTYTTGDTLELEIYYSPNMP